ncbi:HNH endonuclease [Bacillus pseudomycoides]|uniref:Restriction endonuclease n=1 Tax=Bacillus pseudomycoides TaxID=64104 RepID=A0A2B6RAU1_9BACI|nr:HNH endonuclease [Bacillus pseudomycoides]EEM06206.1 Hnh endonuclease [Bacillus pseudomycoides]PEA82471.1 restriction endonuclease [Bacillus pseudomycoides]PED06962.1 restriction endonuclease [Bacillus pseudomycoides]PEI98884.1 restriction endonuclease [Bacillus pseudomycoides]PEK29740.1 restriction endonuclease [Bacillus pseudomycoides]
MEITWKSEIVESLKSLGGEATLEEIYEEVKARDNKVITKTYQNTIRGTIYKKSSDSQDFQGGEDLFYTVDGKGNGRWGLKDYQPTKENVDLTEDDAGFPEGKKKLRLHIYRERNSKLIRTVKDEFKSKNNGKLFCEICKFDYKEKYGELGEDYIEGHHVIPVSELEEGSKTKVEDIILVCANCHRMLHRKKPWLSKEQLKEILHSN